MNPALLTLIPSILDKIFPNKEAADAAKLEYLKLAQAGELKQLEAATQLAMGQVNVNAVEAASTRLFVAGWRPFVGWICGFAIGFKYIGGPMLQMLCQAFGVDVKLPDIGTEDLLTILLGMLGLGYLRTHEKVKGVA